MGVITKTPEALFLKLWENKENTVFCFWKNKEQYKVEGELVKWLSNVKLIWLAYQHIDKQETSNSKFGDIDNFMFKFQDLDSNEIIYITMRPNSNCNTLLLYLLSNDIDLQKSINISIDTNKKRLYVNQEWVEKVSWKYDTNYISDLRNEKWAVKTTLSLMEELTQKMWVEIKKIWKKSKTSS